MEFRGPGSEWIGPVVRDPSRDSRKTVTVLFIDIVDSSRLSHDLDPEALRNLLARYFGELSAVIRRHGGVVDKYIGDAIMAVFGVPVLHEDDALRAVRAAIEMRDTLALLNQEFQAGWGVRLASRIGVNTGEVIADAQGVSPIVGEAINAAKRLEEAAAAGEILIGATTHKLVRDAVAVEPSGPRELKHGRTIHAFSVVDIISRSLDSVRRFHSPLVDRISQRAALKTALNNVVRDRTCRLLIVHGGVGVGKSRLMADFVTGLTGKATVLRGRCLPYGEGITYWPLAEIVREITRADGLDAGEQSTSAIAARLAGVEKAELIVEHLSNALGLGGAGGATSEEIFWAVRKLFEALARTGPLVVVLDDIHWADPTFLDLIEHVAKFSRDFPILLVCVARPELLEIRPGWTGEKLEATLISIDPLIDADCRELIANMLDRVPFPPAAEARIADAAEGNPLFAEEFVAMLVEDSLLTREGDRWVAASNLSEMSVPSTIHALLAARLDGLPSDERTILSIAAVEGTAFHLGAVRDLHPKLDAPLEDSLMALVRRDLIRPDAADFAGEKAFCFRHGLIRDAAYRSLPKNARADLHERCANWLERTAGDRLREFEEIAGYHLEQAFQYRGALGPPDSRTAVLAARASDRLEAAGRRALVRGDLPAAISLLERVSLLLPTADPRRIALLVDLGAALIERGKLADAVPVLDEAERLAAAANDQRLTSHALIQRQFLRSLHGEEGSLEDAARTTAQAILVFERHGDDLGLCHARRLEAWVFWNECRGEAATAAWERAAVHARRVGDRHEHHEILTWIAASLWYGPTTASEGIQRCEAMREQVRESQESEAAILRHLACLYAIDGKFAVARKLIATSNASYADLGLTLHLASSEEHVAIVELLTGNQAAAETSMRNAYRTLEEMGERAFRSTTAASLALLIVEQGRHEEADALAEVSAQLGAAGDLLTQIRWRRARARVLALRMKFPAAEACAREALAIAEKTDFTNERADALIDLSHVFEASRRRDEAVAAASEALHLYELKGNLVATAATRLRLANIGGV
jgi:predicted ATPase/class 3 adenylate cyclase